MFQFSVLAHGVTAFYIVVETQYSKTARKINEIALNIHCDWKYYKWKISELRPTCVHI